jgi:hypothetical protein
VLASFFLATVACAASTSSAVYPDAQGDASKDADVTKVAVRDLGGTERRFNLTFARRSGRTTAVVRIDADRRFGTGGFDGYDYYVQVSANQIVLQRVTRDDATTIATIAPTVARRSLAFTVDLAGPAVGDAFDFVVWAGGDAAPDDPDPSSPYPRFTFPLGVDAPRRLLVPRRSLVPRAGSIFRVQGVRLRLADGSTTTPSLACALRINGRALPATDPLGAPVPCAWAIPSTARGKQAALTVTALCCGTQLPRTFRLRVR